MVNRLSSSDPDALISSLFIIVTSWSAFCSVHCV